MKNIMQDAEWSEAVREWADKKVKEYLDLNYEKYKELWELCEKYPVIDSLVSGSEAIGLTSEEHRNL